MSRYVYDSNACIALVTFKHLTMFQTCFHLTPFFSDLSIVQHVLSQTEPSRRLSGNTRQNFNPYNLQYTIALSALICKIPYKNQPNVNRLRFSPSYIYQWTSKRPFCDIVAVIATRCCPACMTFLTVLLADAAIKAV